VSTWFPRAVLGYAIFCARSVRLSDATTHIDARIFVAMLAFR
jgi:hypothetical protein